MNTITRTGLVLAALLAVGTAPKLHAQIGGAAVVFLQIEPDSRAAGMGNTGVGLADNANAAFWNPAGLGFQEGAEIGLTHSNWLPEFQANLYYEYVVGKYHAGRLGTFGGHLTFLNLGQHQQTDEQGNILGEFRSYDLAAGLSYGKKLTERLSVGTGARLIYSNLATGVALDGGGEGKAGVSVGLDLGLLYRSRKFDLGGMDASFGAGFNLANVGPTISYSRSSGADTLGKRDPIPTNLRFGYSFTLDFDEYNTLTIANDFNKNLYRIRRDTVDGRVVRSVDPAYKAIFTAWAPIMVDLTPGDDTDPPREVGALEQLTIGVGAEYWYNRLFAFRTGYFYENPYNGNRQFLTFGAGIRYNILGVDFSYIYAMEEDHPLSNTMRFSVLVNFQR